MQSRGCFRGWRGERLKGDLQYAHCVATHVSHYPFDVADSAEVAQLIQQFWPDIRRNHARVNVTRYALPSRHAVSHIKPLPRRLPRLPTVFFCLGSLSCFEAEQILRGVFWRPFARSAKLGSARQIRRVTTAYFLHGSWPPCSFDRV